MAKDKNIQTEEVIGGFRAHQCETETTVTTTVDAPAPVVGEAGKE
jgi:hypothetical protein